LKDEGQAPPGAWRDRFAMHLGMATVVCVVLAIVLANNLQLLMPGPLASVHASIENCSACHTKSGSGKLSWLQGLAVGDRHADSTACLGCHKMPETAFNAHSASPEVLMQSTERLRKVAAEISAPQSARAQSAAFPTHDVTERGLYCSTCHQEHQGAGFKLSKITDEQCRSCHIVKFDSFDGDHPKFESYPFKRRTQIIYDHAGHFGKHFPEMAKKDPARRIPETCSSCHSTGKDKRVMAVAPFEQTCTSCHLDQITGKERVSGPKGVAFLALPGLDLKTLKKKKAEIGEWPEASEAELTPFMKVMISRTERGRALIKTVDSLNLQDLSTASDAQIKAVAGLVWEIKGLFYGLIKGKASDVLADLTIGGMGKLSAALIADLTASIPSDVVTSAHQHWLPNLGMEMANRMGARFEERGGWVTTIAESKVPVDREAAGAATGRRRAEADQESGTTTAPTAVAAKPTDVARRATETAPAAEVRPQAKAADQTDDLLFPTAEELRASKSGARDPPKAAQTKSADAAPAADANPPASAPTATPATVDAPVARPQTMAAPVISIKSDVDPESWAEYGGWYRQDYAIFYRPTGHKDKLIYSWLYLAGPQAPKGAKSPAAAVFDVLTSKDAQGSCTKCHSVDDIPGKGRVVNFSPPSAESKKGRFTQFVHEPHLSIVESRGCLTCHDLEKGRPYLKSYEQGNPQSFVSNFRAVQKDLCQTCHTSSMARQDCLTCHKYHLHGAVTPIMETKNPSE
jgi:hypothetical protein